MSFDNENWKQEWTTGEVITANKLNALKDAVVNTNTNVGSIQTTLNDIGTTISDIEGSIHTINETVGAIESEVQSARNYGSSTSGSLGTRIDELVQVSATQPTGNNEIWVNTGYEEVEIPNYEEFIDLKNKVIKNQYITENHNFLSDSSEAVTETKITGKCIDKNGNIVDDYRYIIVTFEADGDKIYKIEAYSGQRFDDLRSIELLDNGVVVAYEKPEVNATLTRYIKNFNGTVRVCYRDAYDRYSISAYTHDIDTIQNNFSILKNGFIDPDDAPPNTTDAEKIKWAMDEIGVDGHGVILIKRMYVIDGGTSGIKIDHNHEANARIIFLGIGKNCGFTTSVQGRYLFEVYNDNRSHGMIAFENILFKAYRCFSSNFLLRVTFTNCIFCGINPAASDATTNYGQYVVYNSRIMQSWHFNGCTIRNFKTPSAYCIHSRNDNYADGKFVALYDVVFNGCLVERCNGFLYAKKVVGVTISECCIEGLNGFICNIVSEARQLNIVNNYFEHNNNGQVQGSEYTGSGYGVHFNFSNLGNNLSEIRIEGNLFITKINAPDTYNAFILLPQDKPTIGYIAVKNNHISYISDDETDENDSSISNLSGIYLVKAHDSSTKIYKNVILSGNLGANYYGGDNKLLVDSSKASLTNFTELTSNDNLDRLSNPGVYHATSESLPTNSPTDDELYLMHLRSDDGFAQMAVTEEGLLYKIKTSNNNPEWNKVALEETMNILDDELNSLLGYFNYGYNQPADFPIVEKFASQALSVKRRGTHILLNGETKANGFCIIKINNDVQRASTAEQVSNLTNGTIFTVDHTYRIFLDVISGTSTDLSKIAIAVYKKGGSSTLAGNPILETGHDDCREFTADGSEYMIAIWNDKSVTLTNLLVSVKMIDTSNSSVYDTIKDLQVEFNDLQVDENTIWD